MLISFNNALRSRLRSRGVECFLGEGVNVSAMTELEPPCSLKWMQVMNGFRLGAFSYAVSGFFSQTFIGRYTSIGEDVQVGRSNHAMTWVSTSPFFYLREPVFNIGNNFADAESYHSFAPPEYPDTPPTAFKSVHIGNDVWVGHGAFILPGVTIGDGAIIGAQAVVTKDVPPYGIVAGNPAVLVRMRLPPVVVAKLLQLAWWRFAPWQLRDVDFSVPEKAVEQLALLIQNLEPYKPALINLATLASDTVSDVAA